MPFTTAGYNLPFRFGDNTPPDSQYSAQVGADFDEIAGIINLLGGFIVIVPAGGGDDTSNIQAAIDIVDAKGGGTVILQTATYNITSGLTIAGTGTRLVGTGGSNGTAYLLSDGTDFTVVSINGFSSGISNLNITGGNIGSTQPVVVMSGTESTISNCRINGGSQCIKIIGGDCVVWNIHAEQAYGNAIVSVQDSAAGAYIYRGKMDQNFPTGVVWSAAPAARANTTLYAANAMVSSGGYYLQCTVSGTSGGSAPTIANYGVNIVDGSVTWRLAAPVGYASLKFDRSFSCVANGCDHTGPFTYGVLFSDDGAAGGPEGIDLTDPVIGECIFGGVAGTAGAGIDIKGGEITGIAGVSGGIVLGGSNDVCVNGSLIFGHLVDVIISAGTNTIITSNRLFSATIGVFVAANVEKFTIAHNACGSSAKWGANTDAIVVDTGTSDYYNITNNIIRGFSGAGVTDNGTGVNKTVTGNF